MIYTPHQYYFGTEIKKNEMGGTCRKFEEREVHRGIWWRNLKERGHMEDIGVEGRIILKRIFKR